MYRTLEVVNIAENDPEEGSRLENYMRWRKNNINKISEVFPFTKGEREFINLLMNIEERKKRLLPAGLLHETSGDVDKKMVKKYSENLQKLFPERKPEENIRVARGVFSVLPE